jgi:prepilin-type N-terminal cleavage/methylation domain-containing protein
MRNANTHSGFSLIEVVVALVILSALAVLTSEAIRSGMVARAQISTDIGKESQLADSLRIIRHDIENAYNYRDLFVAPMNAAIAPSPSPGALPGQQQPGAPGGFQQAQQQVQPGASPALQPRPTPVQVTGFVGDKESLYFSTLSNTRLTKDAQESDEAKVGYYLKSCESRAGDQAARTQSQCLMRSISPFLDDDVTKPGPETVLVENVEEFKLRYIGPGNEDYVDDWKTGTKGEKNKEYFPYAVEVTLTLHKKSDPKDKPLTGTILAAIHFPNNPTPTPGSSPAQNGKK